MGRDIFDPENLFFRMIAKGVDLVGLSLLWLLLCMPLVTAGPATAALYYTVVKTFRNRKDGAFGMYLRAFLDNLRVGILVTCICVPAVVFLAWGYHVMASNTGSSVGAVMYMTYYVLLLIPAGIMCYLFPLMGRFTFQVKELIRTAFILTFKHLPSTVVMVMLLVEMTIFTIEWWWPVLFVPVAAMLLLSLFLERIFSGYLDQEERAVLEDRVENPE